LSGLSLGHFDCPQPAQPAMGSAIRPCLKRAVPLPGCPLGPVGVRDHPSWPPGAWSPPALQRLEPRAGRREDAVTMGPGLGHDRPPAVQVAVLLSVWVTLYPGAVPSRSGAGKLWSGGVRHADCRHGRSQCALGSGTSLGLLLAGLWIVSAPGPAGHGPVGPAADRPASMLLLLLGRLTAPR